MDESKAPADVKLTPEEKKAALDAALAAKVQAEATAAAREAQEAQATADLEAEKATRKANPGEFAGIDNGTDTPSYIAHPAHKERLVSIGGVTHEHVATDAEGVWIYRPVK